MTSKIFTWTAVAAVVALVAIQLVPVDRSNPPVTAEVQAPPEVMSQIRTSCYDCHSNEASWPWYAYVAPVSWFVADHVHEAREHLNFSTWGDLPAEERAEMAEEISEEVHEGEMPLSSYLWMHADARMSEAEQRVITDWADGLHGSRGGEGSPAGSHEEGERGSGERGGP